MKKRPENSAGYVTPERTEAAIQLTKILKRLMAFHRRLVAAGLGQTDAKPLQIKQVAELILDLLAIPGQGIYSFDSDEDNPDAFPPFDRSAFVQILQDCVDETPTKKLHKNHQIVKTVKLILKKAKTITGYGDPLQ